jgi:hypothetical protein
MLRQIADYIDERNPGRLVMSLWSGVDRETNKLILEVIYDHDEGAYIYDDTDPEDW